MDQIMLQKLFYILYSVHVDLKACQQDKLLLQEE